MGWQLDLGRIKAFRENKIKKGDDYLMVGRIKDFINNIRRIIREWEFKWGRNNEKQCS